MGWMMLRTILLTVVMVLSLQMQGALARGWSDGTGKFKVEADLIAHSEERIVLKTKSGRLIALEIQQLSEDDRKFLASTEAKIGQLGSADKNHVWALTLKDLKVVGALTGYYAEDYVIQRQDARISVNGKKEQELPELFLRVLPAIVNKFEGTDLADPPALNRWLKDAGKGQHKYHVEGVHLHLASGVDVKVPIFLFGKTEQEFLKPGLERWRAIQSEKLEEQQKLDLERREAMLMEASARAYQANQAMQTRAQLLQLEMLAVATGATELWEVALIPNTAYGHPFSVVVPARSSAVAEQMALQKYPGASLGATRKFAGY